MITFEQKLVIAEQYIETMAYAEKVENHLDALLKCFSKENGSTLVDYIYEPIDQIAKTFLSSEEYDWLQWWLWDTNCGSQDLTFSHVDDVQYNVQSLTAGEFFEIVWK